MSFTPRESPALTISPELNRTPPTYKSIGAPTARDSLIRLPGARERISRMDRVQRPNSDSTGKETDANRARFSGVVKKAPDYGWI
jgi:hypothetical protein